MNLDEPTLLHEQDLMLALLRVAADEPATFGDARDLLRAQLQTAGESVDLNVGDVEKRLREAALYLLQARALEATEGSSFKTTPRGRKLLIEHLDGIDQSVLMEFKEFRDYITAIGGRECNDDPRGLAFMQGMRGFRSGTSISDNPFPFDAVDHLAWENGWLEARDEAMRESS